MSGGFFLLIVWNEFKPQPETQLDPFWSSGYWLSNHPLKTVWSKMMLPVRPTVLSACTFETRLANRWHLQWELEEIRFCPPYLWPYVKKMNESWNKNELQLGRGRDCARNSSNNKKLLDWYVTLVGFGMGGWQAQDVSQRSVALKLILSTFFRS